MRRRSMRMPFAARSVAAPSRRSRWGRPSCSAGASRRRPLRRRRRPSATASSASPSRRRRPARHRPSHRRSPRPPGRRPRRAQKPSSRYFFEQVECGVDEPRRSASSRICVTQTASLHNPGQDCLGPCRPDQRYREEPIGGLSIEALVGAPRGRTSVQAALARTRRMLLTRRARSSVRCRRMFQRTCGCCVGVGDGGLLTIWPERSPVRFWRDSCIHRAAADTPVRWPLGKPLRPSTAPRCYSRGRDLQRVTRSVATPPKGPWCEFATTASLRWDPGRAGGG